MIKILQNLIANKVVVHWIVFSYKNVTAAVTDCTHVTQPYSLTNVGLLPAEDVTRSILYTYTYCVRIYLKKSHIHARNQKFLHDAHQIYFHTFGNQNRHRFSDINCLCTMLQLLVFQRKGTVDFAHFLRVNIFFKPKICI